MRPIAHDPSCTSDPLGGLYGKPAELHVRVVSDQIEPVSAMPNVLPFRRHEVRAAQKERFTFGFTNISSRCHCQRLDFIPLIRRLRISEVNTGPNRSVQNRTVSWLTSMQRS